MSLALLIIRPESLHSHREPYTPHPQSASESPWVTSILVRDFEPAGYQRHYACTLVFHALNENDYAVPLHSFTHQQMVIP
jgi:hypothetical protein